ILENYPEVISNTNVFELLQNEEFYSKCCQIAFILKPIKELTNILEASNTNLAECFIGLIRLATEIAEESNDNIQQILTDNLNINRIVDLSLPEFLSINNILFESAINRLSSYERGYNSENREYDPINLAQQIID
ncbi:12160_t:CDS:2, partial [Cetraspora pellucida]